MSDHDENALIDAEFSEAEPTSSSKVRRQSPWALRLAILAVCGVIALPVAGYLYLDGLKKELYFLERTLNASDDDRKGVSTQLEGLTRKLGKESERVDEQKLRMEEHRRLILNERERYEQSQKDMVVALNSVQTRLGRSTSRWMAAEAEYLIGVAGHRLQLEGDVATALSALQAADERLRDSADPIWMPVRSLLAEDIAQLKAVVPMDRAGLSAKLSGLAKQVKLLKVRSALLNNPQTVVRQQANKETFSFEKVLQDGWEGFSKLMIVRKHDQPIAAMMPPEQRFFLGQNLRLKLESARLALLRQDQALFDDTLKSAMAWLEEFFEPDDGVTKSLLQGMQEIAQLTVKPDLPEISAALTLLKSRGESIEKADKALITPTVATPQETIEPEAKSFVQEETTDLPAAISEAEQSKPKGTIESEPSAGGKQ